MNYAQTLGEKSKAAAAKMAAVSPEAKNAALYAISKALIERKD